MHLGTTLLQPLLSTQQAQRISLLAPTPGRNNFRNGARNTYSMCSCQLGISTV